MGIPSIVGPPYARYWTPLFAIRFYVRCFERNLKGGFACACGNYGPCGLKDSGIDVRNGNCDLCLFRVGFVGTYEAVRG